MNIYIYIYVYVTWVTQKTRKLVIVLKVDWLWKLYREEKNINKKIISSDKSHIVIRKKSNDKNNQSILHN